MRERRTGDARRPTRVSRRVSFVVSRDVARVSPSTRARANDDDDASTSSSRTTRRFDVDATPLATLVARARELATRAHGRAVDEVVDDDARRKREADADGGDDDDDLNVEGAVDSIPNDDDENDENDGHRDAREVNVGPVNGSMVPESVGIDDDARPRVPETEVPTASGRDEDANANADAAGASPTVSGLGVMMDEPSPGVSVGAMGYANPFAHTPAWPKTQRTTPETGATTGRKRTGFAYMRDDDEETRAAVTPMVRRNDGGASMASVPKSTRPEASPFVIMQRHLATPYANLDAPTPTALTLTTANGKQVIARADGSEPRRDVGRVEETPRLDDADDDAFTFRAAVETPATTRDAAGFFTSAATGAPIAASADAMRRARAMFGDDDGRPSPSPVANSLFSTGGGASIAVSDDAMRRARAMFDDDADASVRANSPKAEGGGGLAFQTAAGTALEVSEAAMRKSRSMFDDAGDDQNDASVDTPKRPYENFPQPSFKTPKSLPVARKATGKVPGFTPPMKTGAAFTPPMSKLGPKTVASAPRQPARSRRGEEASAPVHDMFAARARMGMRAPLCTFFNGLLPYQARPTFVDACVRTLGADTAKSLRLPSVERGLVGWREIRESMIKAGASESLLTNEWVSNAYKWIMWTLASVARAFPETYAFGVLSESAVLQRMLYKYEREINRAERSHVRRILEKDDNPGAPAVFVVSAIRSMTSVPTRLGAAPTMCEIEVSDGWYGIRARLDAKLTRKVRDGRLRVGCKIFSVGAELRGVADAVSPLSEEAEMAYLCFHVNGARLAPWDATLGRVPYNLTIPLRAVNPEGGVVPRMLIYVRHAYPEMYQERRDGDKFIMRCGLAEKRARNEWEAARERALHDLQDAMRNGVGGWGNGGELDSERVVREALEEKNLYERRTSVLIRLNVVGFNPVPGHESYRGPFARDPTSAVLTVWDAAEGFLENVRPGQAFAVTALKPRPNGCHDRELGLSTTRYTQWTPIPLEAIQSRRLAHSETTWRCVSVRAAADLGDLSRSGVPRNEFDALVCAIHVGPARSTQRGRMSQWIFCIDSAAIDRGEDAHLIAVEITGYDDGSFVAAEHWGSSANLFGAARDECGRPMLLKNLEYQHFDAENNVYVARAPMENIAFDFGANTSSSGVDAAGAASELERWRLRATADSASAIAALKRRARVLTGSTDVDDATPVPGAWDEANASQQPSSQYDPPRLSMDDAWNDDENVRTLANTADEVVRLTRSATKRKASIGASLPTSARKTRRAGRG